ncbi:hypothetical protein [Lactiplantibacillus pentosus]|uniref:hypothetical protein n=1 Tax=Lactiplantibacillus pentosus TaxID=1589 RepID=UPI0021A2851E|nr:hypothetical protein [Lactiplantibacillus pentosus]MCT3287494.1 hypothetical protein [Lactiplantibacillus pentosus]
MIDLKKTVWVKGGAILIALVFVVLMFRVDKAMLWLAYAFALLALPRPRQKYPKSADNWYYLAFLLFCFAYLLRENVVGNIGIIVAVISFSPALLVKRNNRDKK